MTTKPDLTRVWANAAPAANIIDPDVGSPGKWDAGWLSEIPPFEYFNYLQQLITQALAHTNEQGVMEWDTDTEYPLQGWAKGSDGTVYRALQANDGQDPTADTTNTYWEPLITTYSDLKSASDNLVVNGTMSIWARGVSVAIGTTEDYYAVDRFMATGTATSGGTGILSRQSVVPGSTVAGTLFYGRQARIGATASTSFIHNVEGVFYAENNDMTLSAWVRSSVATQITTSIQAFFTAADFLPAETKTVNILANTWTKVTQKVTYGEFTGKTFNGPDAKIQLKVQHVQTGTYNFDLAQVQFEIGNVATDFEYKSIAEEDALCHRYFVRLPATELYPPSANGKYNAVNFYFPTYLRETVTPTVTIDSYTAGGTVAVSGVAATATFRGGTLVAKFDNIGGSTISDRLYVPTIFIDAEMR